MTLDVLRPGQKGEIVAVAGEGHLRKRLLDLGLTPKTTVEIYKVAPLGDPVEIIVRGYHLTLRREEAGRITVCLK